MRTNKENTLDREPKIEKEENISALEHVLASEAPMRNGETLKKGEAKAKSKLEDSKKTWHSKILNMWKKGLDNPGELFLEVAGATHDKIAHGKERAALKKEQAVKKEALLAKRAELQEVMDILAVSHDPEHLAKAKEDILTQCKNIMLWGEGAIALAHERGATEEGEYGARQIELGVAGLSQKINRVGEAYKTKKMDSQKYNSEMHALQSVLAKSDVLSRFNEATEGLMNPLEKAA